MAGKDKHPEHGSYQRVGLSDTDGYDERPSTTDRQTEFRPQAPDAQYGDEFAQRASSSTQSDLEMNNISHDNVSSKPTDDGILKTEAARRGANDDELFEAIDLQEALDLGNKVFWHKTLVNALLICMWYLFSICISVYNKWMFSPKSLDFHFPLFITSLHMVMQFVCSCIVLFFVPRLRPGANMQDADPDAPRKPLMTPWFYLTRIVGCGTVTGLDIGLGNTSLKFVTLTFFTMVKSSTLGYVLGFAILFRLEKPSWRIGGIILIMTIGVVMMVAGETAFNGVGFALLMAASACSGLRWSLTQILLRRTPATSNPFATLFFLTPVMFLILFIIALPSEGPREFIAGFGRLKELKGPFFSVVLLLFPGLLAFLMVSTEFTLLKRTSVVTLSVCGIFKEVLTITAAGVIFGDELTPINISGLIISIIAIATYNYTRMKEMRDKQLQKAQEAVEEQAPMLSGRPEGNSASDQTTNTAIQNLDSTSSLINNSLDPEPPMYAETSSESIRTGGLRPGSSKVLQHLD